MGKRASEFFDGAMLPSSRSKVSPSLGVICATTPLASRAASGLQYPPTMPARSSVDTTARLRPHRYSVRLAVTVPIAVVIGLGAEKHPMVSATPTSTDGTSTSRRSSNRPSTTRSASTNRSWSSRSTPSISSRRTAQSEMRRRLHIDDPAHAFLGYSRWQQVVGCEILALG